MLADKEKYKMVVNILRKENITRIIESTMILVLYVSGILKNDEGVPEDEENFDEAIRNVNSALVPCKVR